LSGPLVDIVKQPDGNILRDTTGANVSGVKTGTRNTFVKFLKQNKIRQVHLSQQKEDKP
jgi:hypothetical protein